MQPFDYNTYKRNNPLLKESKLNEDRESLDKVNDYRKALYAVKDLKRNAFAYLEDQNANQILDDLVSYLEKSVLNAGGNI